MIMDSNTTPLGDGKIKKVVKGERL